MATAPDSTVSGLTINGESALPGGTAKSEMWRSWITTEVILWLERPSCWIRWNMKRARFVIFETSLVPFQTDCGATPRLLHAFELFGLLSPRVSRASRFEREQLRGRARPHLPVRPVGRRGHLLASSRRTRSAICARRAGSPGNTPQHVYAKSSPWQNSTSTNRSWPRRTCSP